jgi:hypothetical protein
VAQSNYERFYPRGDFVALTGPVPAPLLEPALLGLTLTVPIADVRLTSTSGVIVKWQDIPTGADITAVDAAIAAFAGGTTTSAPIEIESLGITSATTATLVDVIDHMTLPREAGTYQILWTSLVGMLATVTNAGVRAVITLTRSDGVSRQWEHNWNLQQPQTFAGGITFKCTAGQTIRARLQVSKLGAPAATAQMAMARITIDQL